MKIDYGKPFFYDVQVIIPHKDRQWFVLPWDIKRAIDYERYQLFQNGIKYNYYDALVGSLINVPTTGNPQSPNIRVARIVRLKITNVRHRDWLITRSQFVSDFDLDNLEPIYNYLRHDYNQADQRQIYNDLEYWQKYIQNQNAATEEQQMV